MSEPLPQEIAEEYKASDRHAYWEQRIFVLSPFGTLATAVLIFAIFASTYLVAAAIDGNIVIERHPALNVSQASRLALVLSILVTTILAVQRAVRMRQRADTMALARVLRGGLPQAKAMGILSPAQARLGLANTIGILIALGADYFLYWRGPINGIGERLWFSAVTLILVLMFARGVELTRAGGKSTVDMIETDLIVDLLRIDQLSVWGRNAARFAIIWFAISATACLLFVSADITVFTILLLFGCLAMGFGTFVLMMERVHQKIVRVKHDELERVRCQIDAVRDADAARLQGLLAYEKRIMDAPEWPFDQTTLVRVCASALILTVPWFGQAVAAYVVEHVSRIAG